MIEKMKRLQDEKMLEKFRKRRCVICGIFPCDPCHIKSVGSGGPDEHWNLMSLCRVHHTEQHSIGFYKMSEKYPFFKQTLGEKGWTFDGNKKLRRE